MIARFDNIDTGRFNFNGIPYYKTFIARGISTTAVEVVGIYDSKLVLLPPTKIEDIQVDGITHSSVSSCVNALMSILFGYPDALGQINTLTNLIAENQGSVIENGGITTLSPIDASRYFNNHTSIGAFKITLPVDFNDVMMKLFIEVFDYSTNESFSLIVSGYLYKRNAPSVSTWYNTSVQIICSKSDRNFTVRLGHDGSKCCAYIGELNSEWNHTGISVVKGIFMYLNNAPSQWLTGWDISLETSAFQNVTKTHTNNLPVSQ